MRCIFYTGKLHSRIHHRNIVSLHKYQKLNSKLVSHRNLPFSWVLGHKIVLKNEENYIRETYLKFFYLAAGQMSFLSGLVNEE